VSKTSNIVSILPKGLETKKVYVYMKVGEFSTEALAALGLPSGLVTNSAKYAPVGVLTVDGSFFVGKDMNGGAMLNNANDWNALQSAIISFDPNGMVKVGDLDYTKNNGSSVSVEQVMLARRDTGNGANSGKTAMFVQTSSDYMTKEYGLDSKEVHLDCVFDTVKVSFVGENGQPWTDINGKTLSNKDYIEGQHVAAPGFEVEEGWVLEYYHSNGTTKWNFATDTVTDKNTKIIVKKIGKIGETTVTKRIDNPKANNVPFNVGETVKFTITVQNTGNYTSKEIYVEDKLSGATITNAVGAGYTMKDGKAYIKELAPGAKVVIHAEYTVKAEDAGQNVKNVAVAKAENVPTPGEGEVEIPTEKVTITVTTTGGTFEYDGQPHGATV
ncbi:MAG: DUF11 domain-containing protein, partial [Erysipelotrichaceae bacterium]|nr:DUF11 domain-containing protein [Erysipelotrichaceae bacterium]